MIKPICKDILILKKKSQPATKADLPIVQDLLDTLKANSESCVGMAANMIGVNKCIIAINVGIVFIPMINPVIVKKASPYEAEEGCLSLEGVRSTRRYETIEVKYQDMNFVQQKQTFQGWTAQIIQHEIDHCNGIII